MSLFGKKKKLEIGSPVDFEKKTDEVYNQETKTLKCGSEELKRLYFLLLHCRNIILLKL